MRFRFSLLLVMAVTLLPNSLAIADHEEIKAFLAASSETAYLQKGGHALVATNSLRRQLNGAVELQKTIDGIPLYGGRVTVVLDSTGAVSEVFDYSSENLKLDIGQPQVDAALAEWTVSANLKNVRATGSTSQLVWFRTGDSAEIAWEVTTTLAQNDEAVSPSHVVTIIDAETAEQLSQTQLDIRDYYADPVADIFPRIVINNAIGPAGSRAYAVPFDGVVEVDFGCTGVLVGPNTVMCARHCGIGPGDSVRFGTNMNSPTLVRVVQSSFLPDGGGSLLDGGDVSILRLNANVPANIAEPIRMIDATTELRDMQCSMIGYGFNGVGSNGHNFTSDNRRWGGENIIDRYGLPANGGGGSNIISTDFDNGSNAANTINGSSPVPVEFEATTAPGDSGGPVMVQLDGEWLVAGVLSGGTTSTSVYGDVSWWTGTAVYRAAIEARGGIFYEEEVFLGDINLDGVVNLLDIAPFIGILNSGVYFDRADCNEDGVVNLLDVTPFIDLLNN